MKLHSILTRAVALVLLLIASLWPAAAATMYSDTVLSDSPVFYWNFDEPAGIAVQRTPQPSVAVTSENDLAPSDPAFPRVDHALPRLGKAASFNGTSYLLMAGPSVLPKSVLVGAYAIEFWAQSATPATPNQYIINFGGSGGNSPGVIYNFNAGRVEIYSPSGRTGIDGPLMDDTQWHHFVIVNHANAAAGAAGNRVDCYRDGVLEFSGISASPGILNLRGLLIGAANIALADPFFGALDELAVYDVGGLSTAELASRGLYLATNHFAAASNAAAPDYSTVVLADNPLVYFNFNEADGNVLQRVPYSTVSPNGNDLAPIGAVSRVSHTAISSGLLLGNAFDNPGGDANRLRHVGGWDARTLTGLTDGAISGPWAVEMWVQFKATGQSSKYLFTMGHYQFPNGPAIIYGYTGQTLEAFGGGGRSGVNGVPITDTGWHHIFMVEYQPGASSTNRVDLYLDGVLHQNMGGDFNQVVRFTDYMYVGSSEATSAGAADARYDEVALYDLRSFTDPAALQTHVGQMVQRHYLAAFGTTPEVRITINQQPQSTAGVVGGTASFTVQASAINTSNPLTYQWYRNGSAISSATGTSYTTPFLTINDIGTNSYTVRAAVGGASATSDPALLIVPTLPPAPATAYATQILNDHPLLYWNFDEWTGPALQKQTSLTRVMPTNQNDLVAVGTASGRSTHDVYNRLGNYINFGGAGYMTAAATFLPKSSLSGPYIIEFWAQPGSQGIGQYMMNFGDNSPAVIYDFGDSRNIELYGASGGRTGANGPLVADGAWHHIVMVNHASAPPNSGNIVDCYVDGVLVTAGTTPFSRALNLSAFVLGASASNGTDAYYGSLDELAVYDLAGLTSTELTDRGRNIATNHFAAATASSGTYSAAVLADNPYLYYDFNEANGNALQKSTAAFPPIVNNDANSLAAIGDAGRVRHSEIGSGLPLGNAADFNGFAFFQAEALDVGFPSLQAPWAVEYWVQIRATNHSYLLNFDWNRSAFIYGYSPNELAMYAAIPLQEGRSTAGGPLVTDSQWHHVMWVYYGDGTVGISDGADAYLDGVKIANVRNTFSSPIDLVNSFVVGGSTPGYDGFKGRLDEVAVYDLRSLPDVPAITAKVEQMVASHYGANVRPVLQWSFANNQLTLSWSGAGYLLQENSNLNNPSGWTDVTSGGSSPVVIPLNTSGNKFYSLRKQ